MSLDLKIVIPDITGKSFPVNIPGEDTKGCELVMRYPTNAHYFSMVPSSALAPAAAYAQSLNDIFMGCAVEVKNPFKINGKDITPLDFTKYKILAGVYNQIIIWLMEAMNAPEKN